jgi:hypothetical protein
MVKDSHKQCMLYPRACNPEQRNQEWEGGFAELDSGTGLSKTET